MCLHEVISFMSHAFLEFYKKILFLLKDKYYVVDSDFQNMKEFLAPYRRLHYICKITEEEKESFRTLNSYLTLDIIFVQYD